MTHVFYDEHIFLIFRLDFESGLHGWVQLQDQDTFDFDIQSGKTTSSGTGPATDHTLQEEHGTVFLYFNSGGD